MLSLGLKKAERFVKQQQALGNDVRWDGWDMIFFTPAPKATTSKNGAFRNGKWGYENRVSVSDNGTWEVSWRNVRRSKHIRS